MVFEVLKEQVCSATPITTGEIDQALKDLMNVKEQEDGQEVRLSEQDVKTYANSNPDTYLTLFSELISQQVGAHCSTPPLFSQRAIAFIQSQMEKDLPQKAKDLGFKLRLLTSTQVGEQRHLIGRPILFAPALDASQFVPSLDEKDIHCRFTRILFDDETNTLSATTTKGDTVSWRIDTTKRQVSYTKSRPDTKKTETIETAYINDQDLIRYIVLTKPNMTLSQTFSYNAGTHVLTTSYGKYTSFVDIPSWMGVQVLEKHFVLLYDLKGLNFTPNILSSLSDFAAPSPYLLIHGDEEPSDPSQVTYGLKDMSVSSPTIQEVIDRAKQNILSQDPSRTEKK